MRLNRSELFFDAVEDRLDLECFRTGGTRCAAPRAALRSNEAARLRCPRCRPAAGHRRQSQTHPGSVNAIPVAGPASGSCLQNLCAGAKFEKKTGGPATLLNSRRSAAVQNERWQATRAEWLKTAPLIVSVLYEWRSFEAGSEAANRFLARTIRPPRLHPVAPWAILKCPHALTARRTATGWTASAEYFEAMTGY